jgi:hypothetical protein
MELILLHDKRFLVTGGSGFIGTNLILASREFSPSLQNLSRRRPRNANHTKYFVAADILNADATIHRQVFYLADYESFTMHEWADAISRPFGKKTPPVLPEFLIQLMAKAGDVLASFGRKRCPLTSERLLNMRTDGTQIPIEQTKALSGPLPSKRFSSSSAGYRSKRL